MHLRAYISTAEAYGTEGGAGFETRIVTMKNGRERRNANWAEPQDVFQLTFRNITEDLHAPIEEMHMVCCGMLHCFLYQNRLSHRAVGDLFAIAEPGQTEFQLARHFSKGGASYLRPVYALYEPDPSNFESAIESTLIITSNGSPLAPSDVDYDRGKVYFPPMAGGEILRWWGVYSDWVRFNQDRLPFSIDNATGRERRLVVNGTVELRQMPPPEPEGSSS